MKQLIPTLLLCTFSVSALAEGGACHPASGREIQVSGSGSVTLPPDQVSFTLGVESRSRKVAEAFRSNSQKANAIIATLKKMGVKGEEIQTSNLSINSYSEHNNSEITYIVSNQITIIRKDLTAIGDLIQAAVDKGANQANSLFFSVTETKEARKLALKQAYADARDKAEQLANLAGQQLGEAICIGEEGVSRPIAYEMSAKNFAAAAAPAIETGTQHLDYSVSVIFELK